MDMDEEIFGPGFITIRLTDSDEVVVSGNYRSPDHSDADATDLCPDCQTVHDQLRARLSVVEAQRDQAQKDAKSARALAYEECAKMVEDSAGSVINLPWGRAHEVAAAIRARIDAMLTPQAQQSAIGLPKSDP